jgi:hypothetical protein
MDIYPNQSKHCNKCNTTKSSNEFNNSKSTQDGLQPHCRSCNLEYASINKEKRKEYDANNKEKRKEYNANNKDRRAKQYRDKLATDPLFRLKENTRKLINYGFYNKRLSKQHKTNDILGCTYQEFKDYIEKQFLPGMNWDNRELWHLDHILPVSLGENEEEITALNHYTNFQPLWAEDNIRKGNKII